MCGTCCGLCQVYQNAENLGKSGESKNHSTLYYSSLIPIFINSGFLYCMLACIIPCIPIMLLRQETRERYNIEVRS